MSTSIRPVVREGKDVQHAVRVYAVARIGQVERVIGWKEDSRKVNRGARKANWVFSFTGATVKPERFLAQLRVLCECLAHRAPSAAAEIVVANSRADHPDCGQTPDDPANYLAVERTRLGVTQGRVDATLLEPRASG